MEDWHSVGSESMPVNVQRSRVELNVLEAEMKGWTGPNPPGADVWQHKMFVLIEEILDPKDALAIRLGSVHWEDAARFRTNKEKAEGIIKSLRWHLDRLSPATDPFSDATVDPDLWAHVRGLIEAGDWEKVAREAAVFVETKLRQWASVPSTVTGSVDVFKKAITTTPGLGGFVLGKDGQTSEQGGWQQLAVGFALALRNPSGHQVKNRIDAKRYALGVLGMASLLLTEVRHEYGDTPKP
jgi:Protein of unknown function (Hypoth_ymh)